MPIVVSGTEGAQKSGQKSSEGQKSGAAAQASAAAAFETNLRARLGSLQITDKVKTQVVANTLTLSGQLTPAEHRKLLNELHAVPAGIRIVDDIEYTSDPKETSATDTGWVWVRSEPRGAEILLDYTDTGLRTPARIEMKQGQHNVRLSLGGFANTDRTIAIEPGQTIQFTEPLAKAIKIAPASLIGTRDSPPSDVTFLPPRVPRGDSFASGGQQFPLFQWPRDAFWRQAACSQLRGFQASIVLELGLGAGSGAGSTRHFKYY